MQKTQRVYNKLVRDGIIRIIRDEGLFVSYRRVYDDGEFTRRLLDKLIEECAEAALANGTRELVDELADILEVLTELRNIGRPSNVNALLCAEEEEAYSRKDRLNRLLKRAHEARDVVDHEYGLDEELVKIWKYVEEVLLNEDLRGVVERRRRSKHEKRGGFAQRIFLHYAKQF